MRLIDYIMLMLSMKSEGKRVDFKHVAEKAERDLGVKDKEVEEALNELISSGFVDRADDLFSASKEGRETFQERMRDETMEEELKKINEPWVIVYVAKSYYPHVASTIAEFCMGRHVGFYTLFTEKRFFRRDFRGKKITISSPEELLSYVDMHYIDVIPCVHRIGVKRPDWLVADIDAGPEVRWEDVKAVTEEVYSVFSDFGLNPALKFSGSRGFQIWSLLVDLPIPEDYRPIELTSTRERSSFSLASDLMRMIQRRVDDEIPGKTVSDVSHKKERGDKVLIDPSSMKPMGLVRAPYSIHSKTGLVSMPLPLEELDRFKREMAEPRRVLKRYGERGNEFKLVPSDPGRAVGELLGLDPHPRAHRG